MGQLLESAKPTLLVLNWISLVLALAVVALLSIIAYFYYGLTKRVTFRIQGVLALLDITRHLLKYYVLFESNSLCMFFGSSKFFTDNLYVLLNVVVAMNAHLIGIRNAVPSKKLHLWLLFGAITVSFIINLSAYCKYSLCFSNFLDLDYIGKNDAGICYIKTKLKYRWVAKMLIIYLPIIPGILYCAYISFCLFCKFHRKSSCEEIIAHSEIETPKMTYMNAINFIRSLYLRIALLPFFCFISMFFYVTLGILVDLRVPRSDFFPIMSAFGMRSAGTLNFIAFICDPYFQIAFKRIILRSKKDDVLSYDVESCNNPRFNIDMQASYEDNEFEKIASMKFDHEDLEILGQRKYVKFL